MKSANKLYDKAIKWITCQFIEEQRHTIFTAAFIYEA